VQLGQPEHVSPLDQQGVGARDHQTRLDDGRTDQDISPPLPEVDHDLLQPLLAFIWPCAVTTPGLGDERSAISESGLVDALYRLLT
jgi:hypothetical protein